MVRERTGRESELSRRDFLIASGGVLAGMAAFGLVEPAHASKRRPGRGGTLEFATRLDAGGLDSHRHNQYHTSHPIAAMYTGLTDINQKGDIVPGIAESWEANKELTAWTFRLRKGVLFHNGREVDGEAVKLNILRIKDPAIGSSWHRGAVENIDTVDILDTHTVRFNLSVPDASLPANVLHYPTNLQAPEAFDTASEHPIGTGPFKFVSWNRYNTTELVRFENYWETDADGNNLPYLDGIIGRPKREDTVRLTALRSGQVHLIDNMGYASVEHFKRDYGDKFNTWRAHLGGVFVIFNFRRGAFKDNKPLRTALAHAIDRRAIHHSVFYGQGAMLDQPYPEGNLWHLEGSRSLEYDPDKAKTMIKQLGAEGTAIELICSVNPVYNRECGTVVQDMWNTLGLKVTLTPLDTVPLTQARDEGKFDALIQGNSYRFDPDGFFDRNLHSKSAYAQSLSGWQNERYDRFVEEAKRVRDPAKRKELYTAAWNVVNAELPHFHLHELTMTSAAVKALRGYQPCEVAPFTYSGGGIRTAYLEA
ncbi:MAG: ABC transporter substrate-binding protein [Candidatus Entotheonellia bacterium]